jgi:hypothetical protein
MMRIILGEDHFDTIAMDVPDGDIDELFASIKKSSTKDVKTRCRQIDAEINNLVITLNATNFNTSCMAWLSRIRRKFLDYEKIITPATSEVETHEIFKAMMSDGTLLSLVTERLRLFMPNWIAKYDDVLIESNVTGSNVVAWDMVAIFLRAKSLKECDKLKIEPGVNVDGNTSDATSRNSKKKPIQSVRQVSGLGDNQSMRYSIDNVTQDDIEAQINNFNVKNGDTKKDTYDPAIAQQLKQEAERQGVLASVAQLQADVQAKQQATATAHQMEIAQLRNEVTAAECAQTEALANAQHQELLTRHKIMAELRAEQEKQIEQSNTLNGLPHPGGASGHAYPDDPHYHPTFSQVTGAIDYRPIDYPHGAGAGKGANQPPWGTWQPPGKGKGGKGQGTNICYKWQKWGECPKGKSCFFRHFWIPGETPEHTGNTGGYAKGGKGGKGGGKGKTRRYCTHCTGTTHNFETCNAQGGVMQGYSLAQCLARSREIEGTTSKGGKANNNNGTNHQMHGTSSRSKQRQGLQTESHQGKLQQNCDTLNIRKQWRKRTRNVRRR